MTKNAFFASFSNMMDAVHPSWSIVFRCDVCSELCSQGSDHRGVVVWDEESGNGRWNVWCAGCTKDITGKSQYSFFPEAKFYFFTPMIIQKHDVQRLLDTRLISMPEIGKTRFIDLCIESFQAEDIGRDI